MCPPELCRLKKPVVIDFETYYDRDISVSVQGLRNYVHCASAYIVGVFSDDIQWCGPIDEAAPLFENLRHDPNLQFWAANSNFDQAFAEKHFGPAIHPWQCVLDLAAFHQLPRDLANVTRVHLKRTMDKSVRDEMRGVRFDTLAPERQKRVIDYCLEDCRAEMEILRTLPPMSPIEAELAAHTRLLNRRGLHINTDRVRRDLGFLEEMRFAAMHRIPWVSDGEKPLSYPQFAQYCESHGVAPPVSLDKRDVRCDAWMVANPSLAPVLDSMRAFRGMNTKLEKLKSILAAADDDSGVIPLDLLYLGARHTRRWSSVHINVQNLDAKRLYEKEMCALDFFKENPSEQPGIFMREYFIPPPGKKFGILDYTQIEPRILNWVVGNESMLKAIRAGYGVYEAHALATMGWTGQPNTLKHTDPDLYKFAKIRVLALGYGMGWRKFQANAALPPPIGIGVSLTDEQAQAQVNQFRRDNPKIVAQWRKFDRLIHAAALDKQKILELELPTGDKLCHFYVRGKGRGQGFESYTIRGDFSQASRQDKLWGGTLTENIVQRMARDVLAEAILRLEKAGHPIAFHAHDEIIFLLDSSSAEKDFQEARRIMAAPPEWCPDLPVAVDGGIFEHYTKLQ